MDYSKYRRTGREWLKLILVWFGLSALFGYLFYKHIYGFFSLLPFFYFFEKMEKKKQIKKRKTRLSEQFQEMLQVLISALKSGNSLEKSIFTTKKRLLDIYEEDELIIKELNLIERGLNNNVTIENLFLDLGKRSLVDEIREFSEILSIAKRTGGNLVKIMENTASFLIEKKEVEEEIRVLISGKKMEGRLMGIILPAMLFYINVSMSDVSRVFYVDTLGRIMMTAILLGYLICLIWFDKLSDIRV